eukprot:6697-Eustigmatos_ZCMA.PRE.1
MQRGTRLRGKHISVLDSSIEYHATCVDLECRTSNLLTVSAVRLDSRRTLNICCRQCRMAVPKATAQPCAH